jgi:elongation factor G
MKDFLAPNIRNFAVLGHASTGKTVLCDAMLATAGKIGRVGQIENGTTVSDYHADEKERQISIHTTVLTTDWLDRELNMIDCPGSPDFISEPLSALRVSDLALIVVSPTNGVEVGTDEVWHAAEKAGIPKFLVVNQLDKEHARFDEIVDEFREHYGTRIFPMMSPVDAGPGFRSVLDVMRNKVVTYAEDGSGKYEEKEPEGDLAEKVGALHRQLIEAVAESDDALMEKFFETETLTEDELREHVHDALLQGLIVPVFATAGAANVGVARMMDFIAKYGASPADHAKSKAQTLGGEPVEISLEDKDAALLVFKTMNEQHVGITSYFRVYSGNIKTGGELFNATTEENERLGQLYRINGSQREQVDSLHAGDIGAVVKLRNTHTGNTLCSASRKVVLPPTEFPPPNTHGALLAKSKADLNKLGEGLAALHEEDPTFQHRYDDTIGQSIISGQGEIQLQVAAAELKRRYNVEVELIEPRVPYRETIRGRGESKYRHKKQTGGAGQFAEVWMRIEPLPRDSGVEFTNSLVGSNVDRVFVASVEKGVNTATVEGVVAGYPVTDVKVDFYDGKQHPVDSKDIAFQIAGKAAFKEAFRAAKPVLLEPVMNLEIIVPEDAVGAIMADISGRRGRVMGIDSEGRFEVVKAQIPQSELYKYSSQLRALTGGRGRHRESFSHYEELPGELEQKVIAASKKTGEDE